MGRVRVKFNTHAQTHTHVHSKLLQLTTIELGVLLELHTGQLVSACLPDDCAKPLDPNMFAIYSSNVREDPWPAPFPAD